ncbi:alpha/beta hydrolase [Lacticaseibacillus saniviri]|uniref:alpha/beta hydrolase n=1 Tax=Lacticaseibacillus saniviri TaxID=931533 RepID=UPI0009E9F662|nr:alpha/beta hydrolase [Lacticaseibacillus saniviri]
MGHFVSRLRRSTRRDVRQSTIFDQLGFNIFLADAQGHGQSEGDYIQMGYLDRLDIVDWIQVLLRRDPEAQIVLYGISMGGATVMMTAGEPLPANVKAIIEDCGYTSVADEFRYQLKQLYHVPSWPLITTFGWLVQWRLHWRLKAASSLEALKQARVPMLFFHGDADTFVPASMLDQLCRGTHTKSQNAGGGGTTRDGCAHSRGHILAFCLAVFEARNAININ